MTKEKAIKLFQDQKVRVLWNDEQEKWYFSIVDVIAVLIDQKDFQGAVTPHTIIQNLYKKKKHINLSTYQEQKQIRAEISAILKLYPDEEISIHFSEERSAASFALALKEKYHVALYTSKAKEDIKQAQVKITTSSLSRGYSLTSDTTYLIDSGRTVGVMTLLQMIDRARNAKAINLYLSNGTTKNEALNYLYNKYQEFNSYDYVLRIKSFLDVIKKMEKQHKDVLKFMILDTYDVGITIENIYDIIFLGNLINSNWDTWLHDKTDTDTIINLLQLNTKLSKNTIIQQLKLKSIIKM